MPISKEPVSPIKIFAGEKLYIRKATRLPARENAMTGGHLRISKNGLRGDVAETVWRRARAVDTQTGVEEARRDALRPSGRLR